MHYQTLVTGKRYKGRYVALKSFRDNKVIASGKKPDDVLERANKKGIPSPVLIFVPEKDTTHVY